MLRYICTVGIVKAGCNVAGVAGVVGVASGHIGRVQGMNVGHLHARFVPMTE